MKYLDGQLRRLLEMLSIVPTMNTDTKKSILSSFQKNLSLNMERRLKSEISLIENGERGFLCVKFLDRFLINF
jgi:hypothetical protein